MRELGESVLAFTSLFLTQTPSAGMMRNCQKLSELMVGFSSPQQRGFASMISLKKIVTQIKSWFPAPTVHAHCDGPCGVYDPASARIAAEAVLSMTKKILDLNASAGDHATSNTLSRYIQIKEEQAQLTKKELLVLWTDYFKPVHLEQFPDLHTKFWNAAKLCSSCKVEVSVQHAEELMEAIKEIQEMFWATKNRTDVPWYKAS